MSERWNRAIEQVKELHRRLWPGCDITLLQSKYKRIAMTLHTSEQVTWFKEATIPTSMFFSTICHLISCKFRGIQDRAFASSSFSKLVLVLRATLDGISLEHTPFSDRSCDESEQGQFGNLVVDASGLCHGLRFWDRDFWNAHVREVWDADFRNDLKTWVTVQDGTGMVPLASLIAFTLDPQHPRGLSSSLMSDTLSLITEVARVLDDSVYLFRPDDAGARPDVVKNRQLHKRILRTVFAERVAQKLWSGKEHRH